MLLSLHLQGLCRHCPHPLSSQPESTLSTYPSPRTSSFRSPVWVPASLQSTLIVQQTLNSSCQSLPHPGWWSHNSHSEQAWHPEPRSARTCHDKLRAENFSLHCCRTVYLPPTPCHITVKRSHRNVHYLGPKTPLSFILICTQLYVLIFNVED